MGQGYTRNDTANNIADGNIINAADFDGEYDAIEAAFNSSTGHTHDGTSGEGGPVTVLGPAQDFVASTTDIKPKSNNTLDIGTTLLKFKDLHLAGTANLPTVDIDAGAIDGAIIGANSAAAGTFTNLTASTNLTLASGATVTAILDEDTMSSDSDTALATQQSIKAYIATQIATADALSEILANGNTTGGNNIDVDDNDRIRVGANPDLEIYHDSTSNQSRIFAAGSGDLRIAATNLRLSATAGTETYLHGTANGAVDIYYDNAVKLSTASDGVDITGQLDISTDLNVTGDADIGDDLSLSSDGAIINIGADGDVTLTHEADTGIQAKAASGFELNLQSGDTAIESGDVLGKITFNAPDEASGTDAILDGAIIEAVSEDTFSSTNNTTALVFKTNTSGAATERMRIKGDGTIIMDTQVDIDNITIDGNTISSTDTNGNIIFATNGTGDIVVNDDIISTTTNQDITLTPNGTGSVDISKLKIASGSVAITSILDEDTLSSDSDTALATQQSVKAYVDAQISGGAFTSGITVSGGDIQVAHDNAVDFEDSTDTFRIALKKNADPTADHDIELPSLSGHVALLSAAATATISATPTELSLMSNASTTTTGVTIQDGDNIIINDGGTGGTMKQVPFTAVKAYVNSLGFSTDDPTALAIALG